ncbi:hypothetical protein D3C73_1085380 [compost metagenome]
MSSCGQSTAAQEQDLVRIVEQPGRWVIRMSVVRSLWRSHSAWMARVSLGASREDVVSSRMIAGTDTPSRRASSSFWICPPDSRSPCSPTA